MEGETTELLLGADTIVWGAAEKVRTSFCGEADALDALERATNE
jgi:hypothetical protein